MQITKAIRALTNEHVKDFKEIELEDKMSSLETKDALEVTYLACSDYSTVFLFLSSIYDLFYI